MSMKSKILGVARLACSHDALSDFFAKTDFHPWVQSYLVNPRAALRTTKAYCAPCCTRNTDGVVHKVALGVHKGHSQRWCTMQSRRSVCMYVARPSWVVHNLLWNQGQCSKSTSKVKVKVQQKAIIPKIERKYGHYHTKVFVCQ